ncbi:MAG TPA: dienelactone hydrolase family protein, partial [Nocardioidaceae bacterium]
YGWADRTPMGGHAGKRLGEILREHRVPHDVKVYPGVGHGFLNDPDPSEMSLGLRLVARLTNTEYDDQAADDARKRITAFFDRHLRRPSPG